MHATIMIKSMHDVRRALRATGTAWLAGAICLACGGATDDADGPSSLILDSRRSDAGPAQAPEPAPVTQLPADAGASCGTPLMGTSHAACDSPTGTRSAASVQEFEQMIIGTWQLCSSPSVFGTEEAGLRIDADRRWSKLASSGDELTVLDGWNNEGSWEILDTQVNGPGVYQLNLNIDGSGTVITLPVFAAEPDLMRLDNNGVFRGDYLRVE